MIAARISAEDELYWIALKLVPGLGARRAGQLIERFQTPQAVFRASTTELECAGVPGSVARSVTSGCAFEDAVVQQKKLADCGAVVVPIRDPRYPSRLREIHDPPVVLFARGRVDLLQTLMLAIVGTRRPTPYGVAVAERLAADLSSAHLTIVSGMARGVDTAAHRGTLGVNGNTIAVFGCGVDLVYPAENRKLAERLTKEGLIVSEFSAGTPSHPQNFPVRNRIVSGMGVGVLVVEGAQYSGSSITARLAMEQNREVFAVPGNITSKMSWGPNLLIKQGAKLVQEWTDVVEELSAADRRTLIDSAGAREDRAAAAGDETSGEPRASLPLGPAERVSRSIFEFLQVDHATQLDELLEKLENYSSSEIAAALFELEMRGAIRQLPGKNFVKVW